MGAKAYRTSQLGAPEHEWPSARLDQRIADMRRLLRALEPSSAASALKVLRDAFPEIPLEDRVRALTELRH